MFVFNIVLAPIKICPLYRICAQWTFVWLGKFSEITISDSSKISLGLFFGSLLFQQYQQWSANVNMKQFSFSSTCKGKWVEVNEIRVTVAVMTGNFLSATLWKRSLNTRIFWSLSDCKEMHSARNNCVLVENILSISNLPPSTPKSPLVKILSKYCVFQLNTEVTGEIQRRKAEHFTVRQDCRCHHFRSPFCMDSHMLTT